MVTVDYNGNKGFRLLSIYETLNKGEVVSKTQLAQQFSVTEKTIQRDIDDLRAYLADTHFSEGEVSIQYDRLRGGYYLVRIEREWLTNEEVLATCKILLESRAFCKEELNVLLSKLLMQVALNDRKKVDDMIRNEQFCYIPLRHGKKLLGVLWELSQYITKNEIIRFTYCRKDGVQREHEVKPVAIMFSEYYFYLIAFMADDSKDFPTVFRVDRLDKLCGTNKKFYVPYKDKFNDGEFRKRVQFMYSGELRKITFEYCGPSIESVLDRLPTAEILSEKDGIFTIKVEVYGNGIDMWLRSQGDYIKM
ncbi:helix-turn-helix transcriptional regulator [Marasmitruncus massiliensis]|uniref:helix-turn-helix transcriptional regulator n=1 Tax=Marasmitruncus massiliensis TaxID=1944642 RepID=UPI000C7C3331|nr:WYL domain-containing protein [Marasmitruncus massiliensis]